MADYIISMNKIIQSQRLTRDFRNARMIATYANFYPYSMKDKKSNKISGIFYDVLKAACDHLSINLVMQPPLPENENTWGKMFENILIECLSQFSKINYLFILQV